MKQSNTTHQLKFYLSVFSDKPDETYSIPGGVVLSDWLKENIDGFDPNSDKVHYSQPLNEPVTGGIECYLVPKKGAVQSILKPVFKLLGFNTAKPKTQQQQARGDDIELSTVRGNQVKFGEVVPEIFGKMKTFPDILVPERRYFKNYREHWTDMLLCVGVGEYDIPLSEVRFAESPVISLGADAYARVYPPNASLSAERCADWWHTCPEVGSTSNGSGGLPLNFTSTVGRTAPGGQKLFSGKSISGSFPAGWSNGMYLSIRVLRVYSASGDTLTGDFSGLQVTSGDRVSLDGDYSGSYLVTSYTPASDATPGSASKWTAKGSPDFDYDGSIQFIVNAGGTSGVFQLSILDDDAETVVSKLNNAASQTALRGAIRFELDGDLVSIVELPAYSSRRITVNSISGASNLFGDIQAANEDTVVGVSAQTGTGAKLRLAGFLSDSSSVEVSINKIGERFVITGATTSLITVERVKDDGTSDWVGWGGGFRTNDSYIELDPDSAVGGWVGVYSATPADELADSLEFDVIFPQGLVGIDKKGRKYHREANVEIQYRESSSAQWVSHRYQYRQAEMDQIAFTHTIILPRAMRVKEVRFRRLEWQHTATHISDACELFGLRARIARKPLRYPNFTTIAVSVKGSHAIAMEADSMLSVVSTRLLNGAVTRSIEGALRYICKNYALDEASIARASQIWRARGETFDHAFEKQATIKQAANKVLSAGFAELTMKDGAISVAHDMPRDLNLRKQVFSAQNTTDLIVREVSMIDDDEVDGIDVEYIDERNYRIETVRCRLPGSKSKKVQKMQADGITNRTKAYRWGMRELSKIRYQRESISTSTELDALNCNYGDLVAFIDDVPSYGQSALLVSKNGRTIEVTEPLDWAGDNHVVALRDQFGRMTEAVSVTRVSDRSFMLSNDIDVSVKPYETHVFFGQSERFSRYAVASSVTSNGSYSAKIDTIGYTDKIYAYDNAEADN